MSRDNYAALCVIAKQTERSLLDAGATPEQAEDVFKTIERLAGSFLPPVTATLHINLSDARVN